MKKLPVLLCIVSETIYLFININIIITVDTKLRIRTRMLIKSLGSESV